MIKQILLESNSNVGSLMQSEPFFLIEGEELRIEFVSDKNKLNLAALRNGDKTKQLLISNNSLIIPTELIFEGELQIIVSEYKGTNLARKWNCEPIAIVGVKDETFEAYPVIAALRSEVDMLKAKNKVLESYIADLQGQCSALWRIHES